MGRISLPRLGPIMNGLPAASPPGGGGGLGRTSIRTAFYSAVLLSALLPFTLYPAAGHSAREESASLVFQKFADLGDRRIHVVRKGETIATILRTQSGGKRTTPADIGRLNPGIRNLNRIYPGQLIVLPALEKEDAAAPPAAGRDQSAAAGSLYRVREGDSVSRIILSELNVKPAAALPIYRLIRALNPDIADLNRIRAGQTLRLPAGSEIPGAPPATAMNGSENSAEESGKPAAATLPAADNRLAIIRPVIRQMRGTLTENGNYFIPFDGGAQLTIDCATIPVVELDDGTTVLLDWQNRLPEELRERIRKSWKSWAVLTAEELRDGLSGLQAILGHSRNYRIAPADRPVTLTTKPEILLFPDWLISGSQPVEGGAYRQGLFLLQPGERPLPAETRRFIESNGIAVTEVGAGPASTVVPKTPPTRSAVVDLSGMTGIALAERLLTALGETPVRNAELMIYDQARSGFRLSVRADLLLWRGGKRFLLQTRRLPEEFLPILRAEGTEVLPLSERGQGRALIEELLQRVGIPVSYGYFHIRFPQGGVRPRLSVSFSALRTTLAGEAFYLVDFDMPAAVTPLFPERSGGHFARYQEQE